MNTNIDIKQIPSKLGHSVSKLKKYRVFFFILAVLIAYSYVVLQIQKAITIEPTETQISEKLQDLKRTKIDQDAIKKIQDLESTHVEVHALFQDARDNPFQE
ncbi:hypothetical protein KC951_02180 [Candidatus Saccharibacteria bacterium]|nr:hypothetical protein [Candidatus Saccharibacteria bacterium]